MISPQDFQQLKFQTLKHFWGYNHFRDSQEEIIDALISGKDTLALLPTGGGKSLCYQLPALLLNGTCIVISPLLALMKDQVYQLQRNGIEAEYLSSELDDSQTEEILSNCKDGLVKLLYVSPERITNKVFLENLSEITVSFIAVDEAHCISEWGQDFRPSYQNIKVFRQDLPKVPCMALTATATTKVLEEIKNKLDLKNPAIFNKSFKRSNLKIIVNEISNKNEQVLNILRYNNASGIIYVRSRKDAEELSAYLNRNQLENVDFFHAGLAVKEKNAKQRRWTQSNNNVLVATNAFGMGIDKENVRFVIHYSPSQSVENYYQEIGRAGRDGEDSFTYLLWNKQELQNINQILDNQIPTKVEYGKVISYLYSIFLIADHELTEKVFQLNIQRIQNSTKISVAKIKNILNFLHNQEIVFFNNQKSLSSLELQISFDQIDLLPRNDFYFMELLLRNISGLTSGKVMFSELALSKKLGSEVILIKERLKQLQQNNYVEYIDGASASIKFLKHRDDRLLNGKYWELFEQIQKNKIQKWHEMMFFVQDTEFCKMRLILSYFGEKNAKSCGKCSVCEKQSVSVFGKNISSQILEVLQQKPSSVDELAIRLSFFEKESILENLIYLLDSGKIKMLNFRTYTIN